MSPVRILYTALSASRRREIWLTAVLLLISAVTETVSIGAILPFLAILTDASNLAKVPLLGAYVAHLPVGSALITWAAGIFIALVLTSGVLRLLLVRATQALAFNLSYDLSKHAFHKIIRQDYSYYVKNHSGDLIASFEKLHSLTFGIFLSGIQAMVATFIALLIILFLVFVTPIVTFVAATTLIGAYFLISLVTRRPLMEAGTAVSANMSKRTKTIQEALGGIRDILLDRSQRIFERTFDESADRSRRAFITSTFLSQAPRIVIETAGIAVIGLYVWVLGRESGGIAAAIPTLGALALGAQRLLPQVQVAYVGWSSAMTSAALIDDVARIMTLENRQPVLLGNERPKFTDSIQFDSVAFNYCEGPPVLKNVNLTIRRGESIGIAGPSGSGKSTLMDLLLGLLEPTEGQILVDNAPLHGVTRACWQAQVAHVPQAIYLIDSSLAANIAFGVPDEERDEDRVMDAARKAGIAHFVEGLPDRYDTFVGERGVRLSGGQRQRIGIARALYRKPSVLVLDEATSALDNSTEKAVMDSINSFGEEMTLIIIAHRLTTLEKCDRILRVERGTVIDAA